MFDASARHRLATALTLTGELGVPAVLGMALGYWMSDLGMPWIPDALGLFAVYAFISLVLVLVGRALHGKLWEETPQGRTLRVRSMVGLALLALAGLVRVGVWYTTTPAPLTALSAHDYEAAADLDAQKLVELNASMDALLARVEAPGAMAPGPDGLLGADKEKSLLDAWASLYDQAFALDQVRIFHEDWYRFDPSRLGRPRHLRSFLISFAAEVSLVEKAHRFVAAVDGNDDVKHLLDAPHKELGHEAQSYSKFRSEILGARDQARVQAGAGYARLLDEALDARTEANRVGAGAAWRQIDLSLSRLRALGFLEKTTESLAGDAQLLKRGFRRAWFPAQTELAEWMGDTRVRRIGTYLIPHDQLEAMEKRLEPGDVMVSRKNWYLSNVGLPGFWPHAILYTGSPEKLAAYFDADPAVQTWVASQGGEGLSFSQWLARRHPIEWARHIEGVDGHEARVIEAISEGVVLNSLDHAAGDYLAAIRPRLEKLAKAQAVAAAFDMLGRPYDFDFDFATEHAIVCSEVVWRAYRPAEGKLGLDIPTVEKVGRSTLPANEFIRYFAEEREREDRKFDYVWFIDAIEKEGRTVVSDDDALAATWQRVKWDVAQK